MKIAFLTNILTGTQEGGGKVHVTQIARGLRRRGNVLYTNLFEESDGFIKLEYEDFFRRGKEIDVFYIRIDGWHERDKLTLIRMSNAEAPCIWELNAPLEEMRLKGVSESLLQRWNKERKRLAHMVDHAICVSDEMGHYAREVLGIRRIQVVPNGSDITIFSPHREEAGVFPRDRFNVIWVGLSEYPWQGIQMIREIAERLWNQDQGIVLYVTEKGDDLPNLKYLDRIPYDILPRYLSAAHAGLCIYDLEKYHPIGGFYGSSLKLFDYMASGLPVIGTDVGQIRSVIRKHGCGILTDNSAKDLVEKLLFLKRQPDTARTMGMRGREAVESEYNWGRIVEETENSMKDLIQLGRVERRNRHLRNRWAHTRYRMDDVARRVRKQFS